MQLAISSSNNSLSVGYAVQVMEGVPNSTITTTAAAARVLGSHYLEFCLCTERQLITSSES